MASFDELAKDWIGGLSTYEPGRPIEEVARELGFDSAADIIKLASNENSLGPSPLAVEAIREGAEAMHRYPDGGAFYLKKALASKLGVRPQEILPGNGSNELIEFIGHTFLGPGVNVVVADTAFVVYRLIAAMFRADVVAVPMRELTHDLDAMLAAITPETRVVFVSNPNNPTGTMVGQEEIDRFMEGVPGHVVVCFDEAYIELLPPGDQPDVLKYVRQGRNVIVLRTFSKAYGLAGLRVGYAIAPEEGIALLNRVRQPFNLNSMAQLAALAALGDDEHVAVTRDLVQDGLSFFVGECFRMGLEYVPSVTSFILVKVGEGRRVFESLQKAGVIVRPMDGYGLPEYVRITVGTADENQRAIAALSEAV
ncbi:MAG: histidinol-phosphate transaminase [Kiritimatiellia bacterium]|jgi:histidinol-phosphate aminotransferase|nr:histidinol-phosphate transaminase [Kiritimatiellia bacterium]